VGVLGDWMVDTVDALFRVGETVLTIEALTRHALQPDQRARLEMEARTGENRVARAKAQSEMELQRLLGQATTEKQLAPPPTPASEAGRGQNGRRIERAVTRDPVGDQGPQASTNKCPFSGKAIEIQEQRYRSSETRRDASLSLRKRSLPLFFRNESLQQYVPEVMSRYPASAR
jgi:hypothetical protein